MPSWVCWKQIRGYDHATSLLPGSFHEYGFLQPGFRDHIGHVGVCRVLGSELPKKTDPVTLGVVLESGKQHVGLYTGS